jgi:hypothetical protein
MRREGDNNSNHGNIPSHLCSRSATKTVDGDSTVAGNAGLDAEEGRSSVCDRPHNDNDTFSVETSQLQRAGQIELIVSMNRASQMELVVNTNGSNEAPVSIAQCSNLTPALATVLASNLLDYDEGGLPRVDMPRFRSAKILDKRSGMSEVRA